MLLSLPGLLAQLSIALLFAITSSAQSLEKYITLQEPGNVSENTGSHTIPTQFPTRDNPQPVYPPPDQTLERLNFVRDFPRELGFILVTSGLTRVSQSFGCRLDWGIVVLDESRFSEASSDVRNLYIADFPFAKISFLMPETEIL